MLDVGVQVNDMLIGVSYAHELLIIFVVLNVHLTFKNTK